MSLAPSRATPGVTIKCISYSKNLLNEALCLTPAAPELIRDLVSTAYSHGYATAFLDDCLPPKAEHEAQEALFKAINM